MPSEELFKAGRLCVVGNINRDIKTAPFRVNVRLLRDGETPVDSITETVGGGGANSAFAAAGLGASVTFLGKVGADPLGDRLEQTLIRHGIVPRLARDPAHPTGNSLALTYVDGQRHFVSCQPSNESLTFEDLDLRGLAAASHLLRADIWFSQAMLFGGNERLFRAAREKGLTISLDLNWDPQWGVAAAQQVQARKEAVRAVLPWVNLAHGNVRELNEFAEADRLEVSLERLTKWGAEAVVVHMGSDGAGYYCQGRLTVEPAVEAQRQLNATGTGDVLSVCMMLLHEYPDVTAKLKLSNRIVAQFIEGRRSLIPTLA